MVRLLSLEMDGSIGGGLCQGAFSILGVEQVGMVAARDVGMRAQAALQIVLGDVAEQRIERILRQPVRLARQLRRQLQQRYGRIQPRAEEVLSVHDLGVQVAVVVGGGNYFRGRMAEGWGISRAEADNIGMLGTIMNALMLRGALTARTDTDVRVMTAVPIHSVAEPFIRLRAMHHLERGMIVLLAGGIGQPYVTTDYPAVQRALELDADALLVAKRGVDGVYDSDPNQNPDAVRYTKLTYDEALAAGVRIMDTSAFVLANEQSLTMHVFDVAAAGVMREICEGAEHGTRISVK